MFVPNMRPISAQAHAIQCDNVMMVIMNLIMACVENVSTMAFSHRLNTRLALKTRASLSRRRIRSTLVKFAFLLEGFDIAYTADTRWSTGNTEMKSKANHPLKYLHKSTRGSRIHRSLPEKPCTLTAMKNCRTMSLMKMVSTKQFMEKSHQIELEINATSKGVATAVYTKANNRTMSHHLMYGDRGSRDHPLGNSAGRRSSACLRSVRFSHVSPGKP
mmetsp:Transcript_124628/g.197559  ORF Transcript_124628/g.197559 Transcript_124628/m.197559 type:complete len:217 (-) Transcript_124628:114-764(-)